MAVTRNRTIGPRQQRTKTRQEQQRVVFASLAKQAAKKLLENIENKELNKKMVAF